MEDKILQQASDIIKTLNWKDFNFDSLYDYYYAESELYLIRNKRSGCIYFVKAKSPAEARSFVLGTVFKW